MSKPTKDARLEHLALEEGLSEYFDQQSGLSGPELGMAVKDALAAMEDPPVAHHFGISAFEAPISDYSAQAEPSLSGTDAKAKAFCDSFRHAFLTIGYRLGEMVGVGSFNIGSECMMADKEMVLYLDATYEDEAGAIRVNKDLQTLCTMLLDKAQGIDGVYIRDSSEQDGVYQILLEDPILSFTLLRTLMEINGEGEAMSSVDDFEDVSVEANDEAAVEAYSELTNNHLAYLPATPQISARTAFIMQAAILQQDALPFSMKNLQYLYHRMQEGPGRRIPPELNAYIRH